MIHLTDGYALTSVYNLFVLAAYYRNLGIDSPEEVNRDRFLAFISYANGYNIEHDQDVYSDLRGSDISSFYRRDNQR